MLTDLAILPAHLLDTVPRGRLRQAAWNERAGRQRPVPVRGARAQPPLGLRRQPRRFPPRWAARRGSSASSSWWWTSRPPSSRRSPRASSTSPASSRPTPSSCAAIPQLAVLTYPLLFTYGIAFNTRRPPFDALEARRRVDAAIDRREIVDGYLYGFGTPARAPVPPGRPRLCSGGSAAGDAPVAAGPPLRVRAAHRRAAARRRWSRWSRRGSAPPGIDVDDPPARALRLPGPGVRPGARFRRRRARRAGRRGPGVSRPARGARRPRRRPPDPAAAQRLFADSVPVAFLYHARGLQGMNRRVHGVRWTSGESCRRCTTGGWRRDERLSRGGAGAARFRRRLDRRAAVLRARGRRGRVRGDRALRPRRGAAGRRGISARRRGPGRERSSSPTRPRSTATGPLSLLQAGLRMLPVGAVRAQHPLRRAARLRARQLGRARRRPRGRPGRGPRRGPRSRARSPSSRAGSKRIEAGIPGGRQDQFTAAFGGFLRLGFRDPEATVEPLALDPGLLAELERRMLLVLHRRVALLRRDDRPGDARRTSAGDRRGHRRAARAPRTSPSAMAEALRAGDLARDRRAARRQLAAPADAGPRHVHAADGPARARDARGRRAGRQGGGLGRRRLDVLPRPGRSRPRPSPRSRELGMTTPAGALGAAQASQAC